MILSSTTLYLTFTNAISMIRQGLNHRFKLKYHYRQMANISSRLQKIRGDYYNDPFYRTLYKNVLCQIVYTEKLVVLTQISKYQ